MIFANPEGTGSIFNTAKLPIVFNIDDNVGIQNVINHIIDIKNNKLGEVNKNQLKEMIKNHYNSLDDKGNFIVLLLSDLESYFNETDTPLTRHILGLVK